jgi:hypothetical protein
MTEQASSLGAKRGVTPPMGRHTIENRRQFIPLLLSRNEAGKALKKMSNITGEKISQLSMDVMSCIISYRNCMDDCNCSRIFLHNQQMRELTTIKREQDLRLR